MSEAVARTMNGEMSAGFREWIRLNKMEQRTFPLRLEPCEDKRLVIIFAENALKRITVCSYPGKMGQMLKPPLEGKREGKALFLQLIYRQSGGWGLG